MIDIKQQQKITQQQQLSSQQLQSLSLLSTTLPELQAKTEEIMNSNPVLEYEIMPGSSLLRELPASSAEDNNRHSGEDEEFFYIDSDEWHDDLPLPEITENYSPERIQKRDFFFSNIMESESMQQQLMQEVNFLNLPPKEFELAEAIVGAIDERGMLTTPLADIAMCSDSDIFEAENMLKRLQKIFSPGIGSRDLSECLRLQLEARGENDPKIFELLENLDDFGNNHLTQLAAKLNISLQKLNELGDKIRTLNPYPGRLYSSTKSEFIVPELEIMRDNDGTFRLKHHDELLPQIKISDKYTSMVSNPDISKEDRNYLKEKIDEAENFVNSLIMRENTIGRIGAFILEKQYDFFEKGIEFLKPMTMANAAEALNLHETTISRGCANKYIATPQGVFEFKFFFSGGFTGENGEDVSVRAIQQKIKDYIEDEDPAKPLSDEKISQLLAESGFKVARRTVAKYREQLNILPTNLRRKH